MGLPLCPQTLGFSRITVAAGHPERSCSRGRGGPACSACARARMSSADARRAHMRHRSLAGSLAPSRSRSEMPSSSTQNSGPPHYHGYAAWLIDDEPPANSPCCRDAATAWRLGGGWHGVRPTEVMLLPYRTRQPVDRRGPRRHVRTGSKLEDDPYRAKRTLDVAIYIRAQ
jgi:hypothetical protein